MLSCSRSTRQIWRLRRPALNKFKLRISAKRLRKTLIKSSLQLSRRSKMSKSLSNCKLESSCSLREKLLPNNVNKLQTTHKWSVYSLPRKSRETTNPSLMLLSVPRTESLLRVSLLCKKLTKMMRQTFRLPLKKKIQIKSVLKWSTCSSRSTKHPSIDLVFQKLKFLRMLFHNSISTHCCKGLEAIEIWRLLILRLSCQ